MHIIAHRGYWKTAAEQNTLAGFRRAFELGYGIETDVRDCLGKIVISHPLPMGNELLLDEVLTLHQELNKNLPLALHLNACGLGNSIQNKVQHYPDSNIFCFGNPLPDLKYCVKNLSLNVFTVGSDICPVYPFFKEVKGIWLDSFMVPYNKTLIQNLINQGKEVCIVGEDLYGRNNDDLLKQLIQMNLIDNDHLMICTNQPDAVSAFIKNHA